MSPAERMFEAMLRQLGITEDQFRSMSPADQQKVVQKIQQMIEQQAQNGGNKSSGLAIDKSV